MTSQSERPAANWMDRLSDRIGVFIPGGSRWPARHPVKVILLLGLLGGLSGLTTALPGVFFFLMRPWTHLEPIMFYGTLLASFSLFGVFVLLPISVWIGLPLLNSLVESLIFSILVLLAGMVTLLLARQIFKPPMQFWTMPLIAAVVSLGFAVRIASLSRRRILATLLVTGLFGTLFGIQGCLLIEMKEAIWRRYISGIPYLLSALTSEGTTQVIVTIISLALFQSALALGLGIPVWDWAPWEKTTAKNHEP